MISAPETTTLTPVTTHAAAVHAALAEKEETAPLALATRRPEKVANLATVRALAAMVGKVMPGSTGRWSRNNIAAAMGVNAAYISAYLGQIDAHGEPNPTPPVLTMALPSFEASVEQFIAQIADRKVASGTLFETAIFRQFRRFAAQCISARQWGVFYGPGGDGKTQAARLFALRNPLVIHLTAAQWVSGAGSLTNALHAAMNRAGQWRGNTPKMPWCIERLTGSERVLIIDNAHQLTHGALTLLGNVQDATGIPLILTGNGRILDRVTPDEQLFRRIAQKEETSWGSTEKERLKHWNEAAERLLLRDAPDYVADLLPLAVQVLRHRGCMGSLQAHVVLMNAALAQTQSTDAAEAFRQAHSKLIHDGYSLT